MPADDAVSVVGTNSDLGFPDARSVYDPDEPDLDYDEAVDTPPQSLVGEQKLHLFGVLQLPVERTTATNVAIFQQQVKHAQHHLK